MVQSHTQPRRLARLGPRFNITGASTGRLSSSGPNLTNVPRVGQFGEEVRGAFVPRPGTVFAKLDGSQLELRKCLHAFDPKFKLGRDAFSDLVSRSNGKFDRIAKLINEEKYLKNPAKAARDGAKSAAHAGSYGEGLDILTPDDLKRTFIKKEIDEGVLKVFFDWQYAGGVVAFTGKNLADRLFGSKTYENRRKALEIQELYFSQLPELRQWQRSVSAFVDRNGFIQSATGRYLPLYGDPRENLKAALAFIGQGEGADHMQDLGVLVAERTGYEWTLMVHDEYVYEIPETRVSIDPSKILEVLEGPSTVFPDFEVPFKAFIGSKWVEDEMETIVKTGVA